MRVPVRLMSLLLSVGAAVAQNNGVGLELITGTTTYGVRCGPFSCALVPAAVPAGSRATLVGYGFPSSITGTRTPLLIAISTTPAGCAAVAGVGNMLVLSPTAAVLRFGITGGPGYTCTGAHAQGSLSAILDVPPAVPAGASFVLQAASLTCIGGSCTPAFSRGLLLTVR